jgi:ABC-type antimicrobial peptide transport system permease subunit
MMRRTPLITTAVVLTVMLAIGANTTIFSVVNAVLLRPLPFPEPGALVQVAEKNDKLNLPTFSSSILNFVSWREQSQSFQELGAIGFNDYTLTGTGEPEQLSGNRISPALTRVLGISAIVGRTFTDDEEKPGAPAVAMIGEGLWKRRFGGDQGLVGRTVLLDGAPTTVVGVAPASLNLFSGADIYTPLTINRAKELRLNHLILVVGRLKNGVSMEQAQAEMNSVSTRMGQQYPEIRDWGIRLISMFDTFVNPQLKTGLLVLLWAVGFVLLIACANIANLLLARATIRQNEMVVRAAIGASRGRLMRQLLIESVVLSMAGGAAGLLVAVWASGLFLRSLENLQRVHLGFEPRALISFQLSPPEVKYPTTSRAPQLYRALLDSLQAIPGVRGASVSSGIPFGAGTYSRHPMITTEKSVLPPATAVPIDWRIVSPGYFKTMGIPLLHGRDFTDADGPDARPVMIVSAATAKKFWGDEDPLGRTLRKTGNPRIPYTIIGVVGDVRSTALTEEFPSLYYPMASRAWPSMDVVVRGEGPTPEALLPAIREKVHELDSELALANVRTMEQWLSNGTAQPRLNTVLLSVFAFVALLIASVGIYGVLAYSVSQRTGEIGVRMALGATPRDALRLVIREGMIVVAIGIGAGLLGGLALGRAVSSLVFGVPVRDPAVFIGVAATLGIVALAACTIPALRASRVDPIVALRYE